MASLNKVQIIGHLGRDPEIRSTTSGERVATLSVATSETWKDRNSGEHRERTEWHRVVAFNERAVNFAEAYLKKGAMVYVEGELRTRKWTDQSGQEKYTTEVVISKFGGELKGLDKQSRPVSDEAPARQMGGNHDPLDDEAIPF